MSDLPVGWVIATVGDLIASDGIFRDGDWVETKDQDPEGDVRLTQLADIGVGFFRDRSSRFLTSESADRLGCTFLEPADVLIARMPDPLGRACLFPGDPRPCVTAVDVCIVRPGSRSVDPRWLMWWINTPEFRGHISALQAGTTRKRISRKNLATIEFPVPPLNEQRRIVAAIEEHLSRLDAADASLATASRRLAGLVAAVYATATDGDWAVSALADLAERITKGTTPTSLGHSFTQDGVLFVKAESLVRGVIDHARCAHIDQPTHDLLKRSQLAADDVLVTIAGTLGRVGVVRAADLPANTNQAVSLTRLREPELAPWVATWLNSPGAKRHLAAGGRGIGLQNLNLKQIGEVPVPVPPLEEQRRIVAEVEERLGAIDALRAAIERAQRRSAALRRSVLERAFSGELVPQDPADEPAESLLARIRAEREADTGRTRPRPISK